YSNVEYQPGRGTQATGLATPASTVPAKGGAAGGYLRVVACDPTGSDATREAAADGRAWLASSAARASSPTCCLMVFSTRSMAGSVVSSAARAMLVLMFSSR